MIVYKYVDLKRAKQILKTNSICFSPPIRFNDIFDGPSAIERRAKILAAEKPWGSLINPPGIPSSIPNAAMQKTKAIQNAIENIPPSILEFEAKSDALAQAYGVLSLTRTPTNALMWAHYADNHKGVVIGFNTSNDAFDCKQSNLIPADFGNVVYTSEVVESVYDPKFEKHTEGLEKTSHFLAEHYGSLKRLFLTKPLYWAYEEEVRVVKLIGDLTSAKPNNGAGEFVEVKNDESESFWCFKLPKHAVRSVHLGVRCDLSCANYFREFLDRNSGIYQCDGNFRNFRIDFHQIN